MPGDRKINTGDRKINTGDRKVNIGNKNLNVNVNNSRTNIVAGNRHSGWHNGYHHRHAGYYNHRYNHWNDYWKWRTISGAVALGVYAITRPPYYAPVYYGGVSYYYVDGICYQLIGTRYVIVSPPVGAIVPSPPPTYETVAVQQPAPAPSDSNDTGGKELTENSAETIYNNYYYANGTFYEETSDPASTPTEEQLAAEDKAAAAATEEVSDQDRERAVAYVEDDAYEGEKPGAVENENPDENFQIVAPPIGATVSMLPEEAEEKKIGETTYFVYAGTWYQPFYSGETVVYMVSSNPEEKSEAG